MVKTIGMITVLSMALCTLGTAQESPKKRDAKHHKTGNEAPPQDPELAKFGIYKESAPEPERTSPIDSVLPLVLNPNDRIAFVGNAFFDRAQEYAFFESMLQQAHPEHQLVMRTFAWSADEVDLQARPDNFASVDQHLTRERIDLIFAAFGYNESFAGIEGLPAFEERLTRWIVETKSKAYNGKTGPRIVLLSPIANENTSRVSAADLNNERIETYSDTMRNVAKVNGIAFVDLFEPSRALMAPLDSEWTINGAHLTEEGYRQIDRMLFRETFGKSASDVDEPLRLTLVDKNRQYFRRYRPLNTFYYTGGRKKEYGYLDFLPAMRNFEIMAANRESRAWELARGRKVEGPVDDSNVPPLEEVIEARGANEWLSPADELKAFRVDPRFKVNLFASEESFPEIACPIQMRWDSKGRLWVACSTTYPHVYPGQEPRDRIVILEDTDWDGQADRCVVWADDLHIPLSFELYRDGILVSEEPHLSFIRDTDGDGRADTREKLLTGFGTEDSHHALHDMVWTPGGDLLFRESIFQHSQVETPYGPVRVRNSAWFQYKPREARLSVFGSYPNTNPWGVTFDPWGFHVASHPIFATAFHATNPPYPEQHPAAAGLPAYSGVCGQEFVDYPMWPDELQGGYIKVRYKPTNRVEIHQWVEYDDHFEEVYQGDLLFSENLSFIPVDIRYGPRGAMYVCDWYNPVKGHAQYSLRDPRRDRESGRIWRIVPSGADLQDPPLFERVPIEELLENLKRREYRYRYWTKRTLRTLDPQMVAAALPVWEASLNRDDSRFRQYQLEAMWAYQNVDVIRPTLLRELWSCENHLARAAATRQVRFWHQAFDDNGIALLAASAKDTSGLVRLEAVISATYVGTREALLAVLPILDSPMGDHLKYATRCALGSENLARHWRDDVSLKDGIESFLRGAAKPHPAKIAKQPRTASEAAFDNQGNVAMVRISCIPERLLFTRSNFKVKAGQPVKLLFTNPDVTAHNLLIVQPGALEEIGMAGNEMAKDPKGLEKGFIPESDKILHHTKLLNQDEAETLRFRAPSEPGRYPYLCTFPGHWVIMKGEMIVTKPE